jgi:hypothetical protein
MSTTQWTQRDLSVNTLTVANQAIVDQVHVTNLNNDLIDLLFVQVNEIPVLEESIDIMESLIVGNQNRNTTNSEYIVSIQQDISNNSAQNTTNVANNATNVTMQIQIRPILLRYKIK